MNTHTHTCTLSAHLSQISSNQFESLIHFLDLIYYAKPARFFSCMSAGYFFLNSSQKSWHSNSWIYNPDKSVFLLQNKGLRAGRMISGNLASLNYTISVVSIRCFAVLCVCFVFCVLYYVRSLIRRSYIHR